MKSYIVRIRYYRKKAGMSRADLAMLLGVTEATVANYETGRTSPPMSVVIEIAHLLSVTTDQLLAYRSI